jgi:hypothetical protein
VASGVLAGELLPAGLATEGGEWRTGDLWLAPRASIYGALYLLVYCSEMSLMDGLCDGDSSTTAKS